jgi:Tfp pilus assembly protein PilF
VRVSSSTFGNTALLRTLEERLAAAPDDPRLRFERAQCLDALGRTGEAMHAYRDVLLVAPQHFAALTNLGTLFLEQDRPEGAETCFASALAAQPADPLAHLNRALLAVHRGAYDAARAIYEQVLGRFSDDAQAQAHAHNGLARICEALGDEVRASEHRARALAHPIVWTVPYRGTGAPLRVLVLSSARGGDLISNQFFDDRLVERTTIVPESFCATPLPEHDVIFNGIGEPDASSTTLACAAELIATSSAPVINHPRDVLRTDRVTMMHRLGALPGLIAPRTQRFARADVVPARLEAAGFGYPLLVRAPGYHAGTHFVRVEDAASLRTAVASMPGEHLYVIAYHDVTSSDGWVRKYRVVFVDGHAYPIHLALARQWKVHYFSAAMAESPAHRAEEERFLVAMETELGSDGMAAIAAVNATLHLDYGGVDFGRDRAGRIVVFEANATMTINAPPDDPHWRYRRAAHASAIAAVQAMLHERARSRAHDQG